MRASKLQGHCANMSLICGSGSRVSLSVQRQSFPGSYGACEMEIHGKNISLRGRRIPSQLLNMHRVL
jgi:hypothetical protein